jgi:hypothetical protein
VVNSKKMKTLQVILLTISGVVAVGIIGLFLVGYLKPKPGGILVNTTPGSNVFINNIMVGKTPYEGAYKAEDIVLKLVPTATDKNYLPYEAKLTLVSGTKTVVRREFAERDDTSSGDVVSFSKDGGGDSSLTVISTPDNAQITIDGVARGFAPYKTTNLVPGEHVVGVKAPDYLDRNLAIKTVSGYRLTIIAKLGKDQTKKQETQTPSQQEKKTYVEILSTPTGYLRVRTEPGVKGEEIAQVKPGEKYLFLDEDSESGWFKIQLEAPVTGLPNGRDGWVSNQYAKKIEEATPSAAFSNG